MMWRVEGGHMSLEKSFADVMLANKNMVGLVAFQS